MGLILEPKERLSARVVSGTAGHSKIAGISANDDVVICTLQTAVRAYREIHAALRAFIDSAGGKLMVVFDEAHHAPAPSYTEFLLALRKEAPKMKLLGLTATPTYSDERRVGWLEKLFPQKILFEVSAAKLMAASILAKPIPFPCSTKFQPKFDPAQFQRWRASYQDVPEEIITKLAEDKDRNDAIWKKYVDGREQFGKTIIFADRWYQCDYLREKLIAKGVRADVVYSHVDSDPGSAEARNRRSRDDNAEVLKAFRHDKLDVLINVRMLTEGTDVPKVQSVFLTRQTTSQILLRQMVGRALRGPKFNGTTTANIVLFMDDWREAIQWAEFDELWGKDSETTQREPRKKLPLQLVSIDLIRRLARQMESGDIATASFLELLPLGWYVPEYDADVNGSDDTEHVRPMVLVYADEKAAYEAYLSKTARADLSRFADTGLRYDSIESDIERDVTTFFGNARTAGSGMNLFHLVRHMAQAGGQVPPFFPFEERDNHDLTPDVKIAAAQDWGPNRTRQHLEAIYLDERKFWRAMFPTFDLFLGQFRVLVDGENQRSTGAGGALAPGKIIPPPIPLPDVEPSEEMKREVIHRDGGQCLCCGSTRKLQVDHIMSRYHGGTNDAANLQTLCKVCNGDKAIQEMHFRKTATLLKSAPPIRIPPGFTSTDLDDLAHSVRRTVNMFYQCAAVDEIDMKSKGIKRREWRIKLRSGNPREWFDEHLLPLFDTIVGAQVGDRSGPIRSLALEGAGSGTEGGQVWRVWSDQIGRVRPLAVTEIRPRRSVAVYWPESLDLPNEPVSGKIIRVDASAKSADVRVKVGRSEGELSVPFKSIFDPDAVTFRDEE